MGQKQRRGGNGERAGVEEGGERVGAGCGQGNLEIFMGSSDHTQ